MKRVLFLSNLFLCKTSVLYFPISVVISDSLIPKLLGISAFLDFLFLIKSIVDSIKRFVRPFSFQDWPNDLLPDELKNENPLNINRNVNGKVSSQKI